LNRQRVAGIFCFKCERGVSSWICSKCGTENPVSNSLGKLSEGGCFIATAVYGEENCHEIMVLKRYRDEHLLRCTIGRQFVAGYYRISPPLANLIRYHRGLRRLVRFALVQPAVAAAKVVAKSVRHREMSPQERGPSEDAADPD
jgi:hypothetical protein